jgi:hypothetical protein
MQRNSPAPPRHRLAQDLLDGAGTSASAAASALWIAICAAAPEFIWRGLRLTLGHLDRPTLIAALLIGLFLAFFVEPAIERLRGLLYGASHHAPDHHGLATSRQRSALFAALVGLSFAFASVCLHAAMTAYIAERAGEHGPTSAGLESAIGLTTAWAIVPFAVTLAWLAHDRLWRAAPLGLAATASPFLTAWLFDWTTRDLVTTAIPCLVILLLGYRRVAHEPSERAFVRCAWSVARAAAIWLVFALLVDAILAALRLDRLALYDSPSFWIDVRFYIGWTLGLLFAPFPHRAAARGAGL